jgi:DNA-binding IclR family transcriptional regulator
MFGIPIRGTQFCLVERTLMQNSQREPIRLEAVDRVVSVLNYLMEQPGEVALTKVSRDLGFSKSVVHRLLNALRYHGFVDFNETTRQYRLGFCALQLGLAALARVDIRRLALPRMERLRDQTKETINLGIRVGDRRVYIESLESPLEIRQRVEVGREWSLCLGASSKSILAHLPNEDRERIIQEAIDDPSTTTQEVDISKLRSDLSNIRERGFAVSVAERTLHAFSVAAPIFDHKAQVVASLSISGPALRWKEELIDEYAGLLVPETRALSRDLGYWPNASKLSS